MTETLKKNDNLNSEIEKKQFQKIHPFVDIIEEKEDFILSADMPGLELDKINVSLDKDVLTVDAFSEVEGLFPRQYFRQFRVMRGLDADKIRANYTNGVLTVRLAKPQEIEARKIQINCC